MSTPLTAVISLRFSVDDPALLRKLSDEAVALHGMGHEFDSTTTYAERIVELLLHSNPAIGAYIDYGVQLVGQRCVDEGKESK